MFLEFMGLSPEIFGADSTVVGWTDAFGRGSFSSWGGLGQVWFRKFSGRESGHRCDGIKRQLKPFQSGFYFRQGDRSRFQGHARSF
jgi:hypothetical protein